VKENEFPLSQKIFEMSASGYWITGALWGTGYGTSYEIGIRCKQSNQFFLLQKDWKSAGDMQRAAALIQLGLDNNLGLDAVIGAFP